MEIREVTTRHDRRAFLDLPSRVYAELPLWVAPLRRDERFVLDPHHPFYRHSTAAFFVAEDHDEIVGRIAVLDHRRWNEHRGTRDAIFTLFESIDDETTATTLFETVAAWGQGRGLTDVVGPIGMLPSDGHGILVEGFEIPPVLGVGYHPSYYDRLIKAAGFVKATDYLSGRLAVDHDVPAEIFTAADTAAEQNGYTVITLGSRRELRRWVPRIGALYNGTFESNWEHVPVDDAEIRAMADQFLPIADPRLISFITHGDDIVGYLLVLPDISAALRRARGRLTPGALMRILRAVRTTREVLLLGFGITPPHRGAGANLVMYATLARTAGEHRFRSAEVVQVEEGNTAMMRNMGALGVPWTKRHRIYRRSP
ncbi:MAG: hypothetical protein HZA58_07640 [Acidimicrobiia bacterium]|nr:hypothetical protein [Acidimicrobiia bacterium]